jgi:RNA 2',3'-cyclic 3'-phosphodiesterase
MSRLFFGIPLPHEARATLERALSTIPPGVLPGRLTPADNWHITLRFLGTTSPEQQGKLEAAVARAPLPGPFDLRLGSWGAFPGPQRARVFWIGVEDTDGSLVRLAGMLEHVARVSGFAPEDRPFKPHVTLARFRVPVDVRPLLNVPSPIGVSLRVAQVTLFESQLGSGAPRYEAIAMLPLPDPSRHETL